MATTKFPFRSSAYRSGWHSLTFSVTQVDWYPSGIVGVVQSEERNDPGQGPA